MQFALLALVSIISSARSSIVQQFSRPGAEVARQQGEKNAEQKAFREKGIFAHQIVRIKEGREFVLGPVFRSERAIEANHNVQKKS